MNLVDRIKQIYTDGKVYHRNNERYVFYQGKFYKLNSRLIGSSQSYSTIANYIMGDLDNSAKFQLYGLMVRQGEY